MKDKNEVPKSFSIMEIDGIIVIKKGTFPSIKTGHDLIKYAVECESLQAPLNHLPSRIFYIPADEDVTK